MLAVTAFGARASSYDDFNQGIGAHNRGDAAGAIAAFTRALAAGDLAPSLHTVALLDRGFAYLALKQYQTAIADFSEVIAEKPQRFRCLRISRARAYDQMGNFGGALPDCKTVNQLLPKQPQLLADADVSRSRRDNSIRPVPISPKWSALAMTIRTSATTHFG